MARACQTSPQALSCPIHSPQGHMYNSIFHVWQDVKKAKRHCHGITAKSIGFALSSSVTLGSYLTPLGVSFLIWKMEIATVST